MTERMTDEARPLVERLRSGVYGTNRIPLCDEAANEIERLNEAQADKMVGELSSGKCYVYPVGDKYREGTRGGGGDVFAAQQVRMKRNMDPKQYAPMTVINYQDDDALRFVQRVLESEAPQADKKAARDMIVAIRVRLMNESQKGREQ